MAYRVEPNHEPEAEITRIIQEQVVRAQDAIRPSSASPAEQARRARVACKKIRAVLRLACPHKLDTAKHPECRFRDAGRTLSELREAGAVVSTLERLQSEADGNVDGRSLYVARRAVTTIATPNHAEDADANGAFKAFERALARASAGLENDPALQLAKTSTTLAWAAAGFEHGYAQARRSFRKARQKRSATTLHTWRKRTKTHAYHCALLAPAWPAMMQPWREALQQLAAALGYERDLGLLSERIRESLTAQEESDGRVRPLLKWIKARRAALRKEAFSLGDHVFAEKPKVVTQRVAALWQAAR